MAKLPLFIDLFRGATPVEARRYAAGAFVFRQGEPVRHLHVLESGQVRLERSTLEGRTVLMYVAGAGDSFAEASLLADTFHCNAVASRPSRILLFPKDSVLRAIRSDAETAERFIGLLASQVRTLRSRLELRNILSARDRILHYLFLAASDGGEVILHTSLKDLAAELGLAHETLYRELARLEKDGLVGREGNRIRILGEHAGD